MNIDYTKLNKKHWFEDAERNVIPCEENEVGRDAVARTVPDNEVVYYHHCFPLELHDQIDEYCYHPENPIEKWLCRKSKRMYKLFSKGKDRTFEPIMDCTSTYGCGQECIVSMVNSGDFTLEQAIWVYANSCERCMNALEYKYLDGKSGYPEYSDEWKKCNTECDFCKK